MKQEKISLAMGLRWRQVLAVIILIVYQVIGQVILSSLVIHHAEDQCIDRLRDATREFSSTYYEHAMSDREQLRVVADMISVLMDEGTHDLHTHLASFEQRGMLDWLQILLPDGSLVTGSGTYDLSGQVSFEDEIGKLPFLSNVSPGYVDSSKRVIRSAVPVLRDDETIAVLYGVYDLTAGHVLDGVNAYAGNTYTFVLEADSGNYILDGLRGSQSIGITDNQYEAKRGFDLQKLHTDLLAGNEGYSAFRSKSLDGYMYLYYAPIGINNWMTMVSLPESVAMSFAFESRDLMLGSIVYISLGVIIYFIIMSFVNHKLHDKNNFVSRIQSQLMEVYHKPDYYQDALLAVATRAKSDAVFLIDMQLPRTDTMVGSNEKLITDYQETNGIKAEICDLCQEQHKPLRLRSRNRILLKYPQLHQFMVTHDQRTLAVSPIFTPEGSLHQIMGAFDPDNMDTLALLNTTAVDFFMAANNLDYLSRLEIASTVDALTGVMNRTSYQLRLDKMHAALPDHLGCVYIDVNDLHAINNRFGHEKGDEMLRAIAAALSDAFGKSNVYRFGGDEFIIFTENVTRQWLDNMITQADNRITKQGYAISFGAEWSEHPSDLDAIIRSAESLMYKAKYRFYQQKEKRIAAAAPESKAIRRLVTENQDVDAFMQVAEHRYQGIYILNLVTGDVRELLARSYFYSAIQTAGQSFSDAFHHYIAENVDKQSRRNLQNFFDYKQIGEQISAGESPVVEYTKVDGERIRLSVHRTPRYTEDSPETLWVFEIV